MKTFSVILVILVSLLVFISCSPRDAEHPEFAAQEDAGIMQEDLGQSLEMCQQLLRDYYLSKANPGLIEFERYIVDENLMKYSRAKIKKEAQNLNIIAIDISLVNAELEDDGYFISLNAVVKQSGDSRFGEGTHFLVKNVDGRLVVADWFTEHGTVSFFDLQHRGNCGVTNPTIWENPEIVQKLFAGINQ
ncbi:MAG: hypothetical protein PHW26_06200 [Eubacteriales bacterium]|nr:hypothetical protein [Eubacteriales bacterium]